MISKPRTYTQQDYDNAIKRISKLINIEEIKNLKELDKRLKEEKVYHDILGGNQTIYSQLKKDWTTLVKPEKEIKEEIMVKKPRLSQRARLTKIRQIRRIEGTTALTKDKKVKVIQGTQRILHKNRWHKADNIIIQRYSRTTSKGYIMKWVTRRKPKKKTK